MLLPLHCEDEQLPFDPADTWRMLVVILRRQGVPLRDPDLVATRNASIDAGVVGWRTRCVSFVVGAAVHQLEVLA